MNVILKRREFKHVNGVIKVDNKEINLKRVTKIEIDDKALFIDYFDYEGKETLFTRRDEVKNLIIEE